MIAAEIALPMDNSSVWNGIADMEQWCLKKFGPEARELDQVSDEYSWRTRYYSRGPGATGATMYWCFAREEYATMFALRWL